MRFFTAAFGLHLRRLLRRPFTLACLLLMPVLVLLLGLFLPQEDSDPVRVGVVIPAESAQGEVLWQTLQDYSGQDILFLRADGQEQLEDLVAAQSLECGYLLPQDLDARLESGQFARLVVRVDGASSTLGPVLDWTVAAALLDVCAPGLANASLVQSGVLTAQSQREYAELAGSLFHSQSGLSMELVPLNGDVTLQGQSGALAAASVVRGTLALLLLLFSCMCAVWFAQDRQAGFFGRLGAYAAGARLYLPFFAAAGLLAAGATLLSLGAGVVFFPGYFGGFGRETLLLLLYLVCLGSLSFLLAMLFPKGEGLVSALPFLMIGCLLFCPILVDLSGFVPALSVVSVLLAPTPYLRAAAGGSALGMLVYAAICLALGAGLAKWRRKL